VSTIFGSLCLGEHTNLKTSSRCRILFIAGRNPRTVPRYIYIHHDIFPAPLLKQPSWVFCIWGDRTTPYGPKRGDGKGERTPTHAYSSTAQREAAAKDSAVPATSSTTPILEIASLSRQQYLPHPSVID
jgi:hypothetical protein